MPDSLALDLARVQFGFTISFHIIFPAITIGLASYLALLELLWLRTGEARFRDLYRFFSKLFGFSDTNEMPSFQFSLPNNKPLHYNGARAFCQLS